MRERTELHAYDFMIKAFIIKMGSCLCQILYNFFCGLL